MAGPPSAPSSRKSRSMLICCKANPCRPMLQDCRLMY